MYKVKTYSINKKRRITSRLIGLVILTTIQATTIQAATVTKTETPTKIEKIGSRGTVLIEADSRRVLYGKHATDEMPMASTTKIMTCLLALEKGNLEDVVVVSKRASRAPKVKLGLKENEKQTLRDLLYSLMMESHNDSAVAIAEHIGGSVEVFCEMMTEKAQALGAKQTSFKTPNGLDAENHYSTPYDMALITSYAIDNPQFIEITNTLEKTLPSEPLEGSRPHALVNKNRFLREYEGAIGVKTGYTSKAGHCFVGAADRGNMQLIAVALGAGCDKGAKTRKYTDVKKMINYGYKDYQKYLLTEKDALMGTVAVTTGKDQEVQVKIDEEIILPLTQDEKDQVELKITLPNEQQAPILADVCIGKVEVVCGNDILKTVELYPEQAVQKATLWDQIKQKWHQLKN